MHPIVSLDTRPLSFLCCQFAMILGTFSFVYISRSWSTFALHTIYQYLHASPYRLTKTDIYLYIHKYMIWACVADGRWRRTTCVASGMSAWSLPSHVYFLFEVYPPAVLVKDDKRRTPLQHANTNLTIKRASVELIDLVHYISM